MHRRALLKNTLMTGTSLIALTEAARANRHRTPTQLITIIDLDRCDGCSGHTMPLCVKACRDEHIGRTPEPEKPLRPYWPQTKFEDYSEERDRIDRLTPYNLLYVEKVTIDGKTYYLPRRCMHCFDAPCRKLCPFGAIDKNQEGALVINEKLCFGGAKCRDVCPWGIPQRQAGVGLYLELAPKFAGGGVMFKCDLCEARLARGEVPACVTACPRQAMMIGTLDDMTQKLESIRGDRHVYGKTENGGTATWYVSSHSFEEIHQAIQTQVGIKTGQPGFPKAEPKLRDTNTLAGLALAAPVVALGGALALRRRNKKEEDR